MNQINRPMLSGKVDLKMLKYPVLCTPKIDGIRALVIDGQLVSRNFKPIPNDYIREMFSSLPNGLDGELVGANGKEAGLDFNDTQSAIMRKDGEPDVIYCVFDYVKDNRGKGYQNRMRDLILLNIEHPSVRLILPVMIDNEKILLAYEAECLGKGYEGVMIRSVGGPYKEGRSTTREGYLLKFKRFEDSEAKIIGFEEKQHNENIIEQDAFGNAKRSTSKSGLVGAGTLGKIYVSDIKSNIEFEIGTGFSEQLRQEIWDNQTKWLGKIVKYKYQACGMKEKPRFPVYLGLRDERDMS